jgi:hypothetical protein
MVGVAMKQVLYEIWVRGHLEPNHSGRLANLAVRPTFDYHEAITILSGSLPDQSALYGVLYQLQNMGVQLLEVRRKA